ncbi:MAG: O-antigen ligase family protein [Acidimicrobiales bacterium]
MIPVLAALIVLSLPTLLVKVIAVAIGLGVVVAAARRPQRALAGLIVLVPFQAQIFSGIYSLGVPPELVGPLAQWKEIAVVGVLVAGIRRARREHHHIDRLDAAGLLYVGLGTLYMLFPNLILQHTVGSDLDFSTRLLGWRTDVLYIALLLACRHLRLSREVVARLVKIFLTTATVIAAIAFFEFMFPATWNSFMIERLQLDRYKLEVLHIDPLSDRYLYDVRVYTSVAGSQVLRVGSVMLQYYALGFYMVGAIAVLADRVVRGLLGPRVYVALTLAGGALLLTQTRSAILAALVVLFLTLLRRSGSGQRAADARMRFSIVLGALVVVAIPAALAMGLVARFNGKDDVSSNDGHSTRSSEGYAILVENPLGLGLATSAGAGQRSAVKGYVNTETQYLEIGVQLGVAGLVLWLATVIGTIVALGRAVARAPNGFDTGLATATRSALIGLFAAGVVFQTYIDFSVCWSIWPLAGLALGMTETAKFADASGGELVHPAG